MSSIKLILLQEKVERRIRRGIKNGLWEVVDLKKKEGRKGIIKVCFFDQLYSIVSIYAYLVMHFFNEPPLSFTNLIIARQ